MIWVKRLLPFVIIAVAVYLYLGYTQRKEQQRARIDNQYALATAKIWVASAKLRATPREFERVRDSLLAASSLTADDLREFVAADSSMPEKLSQYMSLVQIFVDSLLEIEDSLALEREDSLRRVVDSTR